MRIPWQTKKIRRRNRIKQKQEMAHLNHYLKPDWCISWCNILDSTENCFLFLATPNSSSYHYTGWNKGKIRWIRIRFKTWVHIHKDMDMYTPHTYTHTNTRMYTYPRSDHEIFQFRLSCTAHYYIRHPPFVWHFVHWITCHCEGGNTVERKEKIHDWGITE